MSKKWKKAGTDEPPKKAIGGNLYFDDNQWWIERRGTVFGPFASENLARAENDGEALTKCGGEGSGVPGPCPTGTATAEPAEARKPEAAAHQLNDLFGRISKPDGGFTYQPISRRQPKEGFALSPYPERSFAKEAKDLKPADIATYVAKNRDILKQADHFVGAWHDPASGKVFLDVSVVKNDPKEAEKFCRDKDQIAYFDLKAGKSVTVNSDATSGGVKSNGGRSKTFVPSNAGGHNGRGNSGSVQGNDRAGSNGRRNSGIEKGAGRAVFRHGIWWAESGDRISGPFDTEALAKASFFESCQRDDQGHCKPGSGGGGSGGGEKPAAEKPAEGEGSKPGSPINVNNAKLPDQIAKSAADYLNNMGYSMNKVALKNYTEAGSDELNKLMRQCPPKFECVEAGDRMEMNLINDAIENAPKFEKPVSVYRGLHGAHPEIVEQLKKTMEAGGEFSMPSITSTSTDPKLVLGKFTGENGLVFQIKAKSGLCVASMSPYPEESEIIQSSNTRYKVVSVNEGVKFTGGAKDETRTVAYLEEI